jgi:hypothetical protein
MIAVYGSHDVIWQLAQLDLHFALSAALMTRLNQSTVGASGMGNAPVVCVVCEQGWD